MAFVREKHVKSKATGQVSTYYILAETRRVSGKKYPVYFHIAYLGTTKPTQDKIDQIMADYRATGKTIPVPHEIGGAAKPEPMVPPMGTTEPTVSKPTVKEDNWSILHGYKSKWYLEDMVEDTEIWYEQSMTPEEKAHGKRLVQDLAGKMPKAANSRSVRFYASVPPPNSLPGSWGGKDNSEETAGIAKNGNLHIFNMHGANEKDLRGFLAHEMGHNWEDKLEEEMNADRHNMSMPQEERWKMEGEIGRAWQDAQPKLHAENQRIDEWERKEKDKAWKLKTQKGRDKRIEETEAKAEEMRKETQARLSYDAVAWNIKKGYLLRLNPRQYYYQSFRREMAANPHTNEPSFYVAMNRIFNEQHYYKEAFAEYTKIQFNGDEDELEQLQSKPAYEHWEKLLELEMGKEAKGTTWLQRVQAVNDFNAAVDEYNKTLAATGRQQPRITPSDRRTTKSLLRDTEWLQNEAVHNVERARRQDIWALPTVWEEYEGSTRVRIWKPSPFKKAEAPQVSGSDYEEAEVNLEDLYVAAERGVTVQDLDAAEGSDELATVIKYDGKLHIQDGHAILARKYYDGKRAAKVKLIDADAKVGTTSITNPQDVAKAAEQDHKNTPGPFHGEIHNESFRFPHDSYREIDKVFSDSASVWHIDRLDGLYSGYEATRAAIRAQCGNKVTLYRTQYEDSPIWHYFGTPEELERAVNAQRHSTPIKPEIIKEEVDVDDIVAAYNWKSAPTDENDPDVVEFYVINGKYSGHINYPRQHPKWNGRKYNYSPDTFEDVMEDNYRVYYTVEETKDGKTTCTGEIREYDYGYGRDSQKIRHTVTADDYDQCKAKAKEYVDNIHPYKKIATITSEHAYTDDDEMKSRVTWHVETEHSDWTEETLRDAKETFLREQTYNGLDVAAIKKISEGKYVVLGKPHVEKTKAQWLASRYKAKTELWNKHNITFIYKRKVPKESMDEIKGMLERDMTKMQLKSVDYVYLDHKHGKRFSHVYGSHRVSGETAGDFNSEQKLIRLYNIGTTKREVYGRVIRHEFGHDTFERLQKKVTEESKEWRVPFDKERDAEYERLMAKTKEIEVQIEAMPNAYEEYNPEYVKLRDKNDALRAKALKIKFHTPTVYELVSTRGNEIDVDKYPFTKVYRQWVIACNEEEPLTQYAAQYKVKRADDRYVDENLAEAFDQWGCMPEEPFAEVKDATGAEDEAFTFMGKALTLPRIRSEAALRKRPKQFSAFKRIKAIDNNPEVWGET